MEVISLKFNGFVTINLQPYGKISYYYIEDIDARDYKMSIETKPSEFKYGDGNYTHYV